MLQKGIRYKIKKLNNYKIERLNNSKVERVPNFNFCILKIYVLVFGIYDFIKA